MDVLTMTEAARRLKVSPMKIRALVRQGVLPARKNPLDGREKLIPLAAVQELEDRVNRPARPRPRSIGLISDPDFQSEHYEEYMDAHRPR